MKKSLLLLLASLFSFAAFGQALPSPTPRVTFPTTVVGNVVTYGPLTADASNAAKFSFGAAANGAVFANTGTSLATAGGSSVNLAVAGSISKAAAARAVGRFAAKTIPFLNTGVALYDLAQELGFTASASSNAPPTFSTVTPGGCYYWSQSGVCGSAGTFSSAADAAFLWGGSTAYVEVMPTATQVGRMVSPQYRDSNNLYFTQGPSVTKPATLQNFIDSVNARTTWPADSSLGRTVLDALNSGESASVEPVAVTGPATSPGITSQTVVANDPATNPSTNPANNPNTSTSTSTVTNNYTYNGPSVSTTTTTVNTTVNNSTGAVTKASTATESPVAPVPSSELVTCGLPGKPACKIDETGTPVYDPKKFELDRPTLDAASKTQRETVSSTTDKSTLFTPWAMFFRLPPLAACTPITMPVYAGAQIASLDVCPAAEWLRGLMGFVWAAVGFFFVFKTVQDAI